MAGRKQKPYRTSWGEYIPGLYRLQDGRWRITGTTQKFTERDERIAIKRFRELTGKKSEILIPLTEVIQPTDPEAERFRDKETGLLPTSPTIQMAAADERAIWGWVRHQLDHRPQYVADALGCPELANWKHWALPNERLSISEVIANYRQHSPASVKAKREALSALQRLIDHSQARYLDDLTTPVLLSYKAKTEKEIPGASTRRAYYQRVRTVIRFGLQTGMDAGAIGNCLNRLKVLWTAEALPAPDPTPISREHFHKLLQTANDSWQGFLLLALNCCLSVDEACDLRWEHLDLDNGTFARIRGKTKRKRIPRAAALWDETVEWLQKQSRRGPYVFISSHGTRFNRNTRLNDFADLREKAGVPSEITFNWLRDGAYSAAVSGTNGQAAARVLAGHAAPGLEDRYVLRNPGMTKMATDAVYQVYGPFPEMESP